MVSTVALLAVLVGGILVVVAASMWRRQFGSQGTTVQGTVMEVNVVDSSGTTADRGLAVAFEYRVDGERYESRSVIHPPGVDDAEIPAAYRRGSTVTVSVPPGHPGEGMVPDPGIRATYRVAVPGIALTGLALAAIGIWLAL